MILYLVRHGIAIDRDDPAAPEEAARALTEEGSEKTRGAAQGLRALGAHPRVFLSSPYTRAIQTAEIVAGEFGVSKSAIRKLDALAPGANPRAAFAEIAKHDGEEVACFGHAPHLDEMIALAIGAKERATALKKAGVACLDLSTVAPPRGALEWLLTAKMLRAIGRDRG